MLAMEAWHKYELNAGNITLHKWTDRNDLAEARPNRNIILGLAMNLARPAANAP